nr:polyprotein [Zucchini yellow fleck virus]
MASLVSYVPRNKLDVRRHIAFGDGYTERRLQRKADNGHTKYWMEYQVDTGAKILYFMMHATAAEGKELLKKSPRQQNDVLDIARKSMISRLGYEFDTENWVCPDCDYCNHKFFRICPECDKQFLFTESNLLYSIDEICDYFQVSYEDIKHIGMDFMIQEIEKEEKKEEEFVASVAASGIELTDELVKEMSNSSVEMEAEEANNSNSSVEMGVEEKVINVPLVNVAHVATPEVASQQTIMIGYIEIPLPVIDVEMTEQAATPIVDGFSMDIEQPINELVNTALEIATNISQEKKDTKVHQSRSIAIIQRSTKLVRDRKEVRKMMRIEANKESEIFSKLEQKLSLRKRRRDQVIVRNVNGVWRWKSKRKTRSNHLKSEERVIEKMEVDMPESVQTETLIPGIKAATSRKMKIPRKQTIIKGINMQNHVMRELGRICKRNSIKVELISRRKTRSISFKNGLAYVKLKHMEHKRHRIDLNSNKEMDDLFEWFAQRTVKKFTCNHSLLTHGSSGLVFRTSNLKNLGRHRGAYFITRGRYESKLIDARSRISHDTALKIKHYTDIPERFWSGFNQSFIRNRKPVDHTCTSDLDVKTCGEVAALVTLILFPCHRITCKTCLTHAKERLVSEVGEDMKSELERLRSVLDSYGGGFGHVSNLLDQLSKVLNAQNDNDTDFKEIASKIDDRTEAPWKHLSNVNNILIKGSSATGMEFATATRELREVVRWHLKRTESIRAGSVKDFRNKRSGKAHFNPALTCDNQLDKNGNFLWGERQHHAKRFFVNYFEKIDHKKGYEFYSIRKNPNGVRKIGIGNLLFSTNLERFRQQMKGEHVEQGPITRECLSLRHGNWVHACCCVTLDDGQPLLSEIKMPTKNHIVLGNSGDPKYVDMPVLESDSMYIAKEGYCYMNIFLAMLVNIPEGEAKDFTKKVRDLVGAKLGTWPTLRDVATCANQLILSHPDAANAELPRILVDHVHKTMHVVDSYGSISTGYHVLKANTVNQLIQFSREPLDSEMMHYLVGGDNFDPTQICLTQLIKCIYKPTELYNLLKDEPYMITIALESPSVLLTLFNSGAVERALTYWIKRDQDVTDMIVLIEHLSKKVTVAQTIEAQFNEIRTHAPALKSILGRGTKPWVTFDRACNMVDVFVNAGITDEALLKQGYAGMGSKMRESIEKTYALILQEEWNALSLWQRLQVRYYSYKAQPSYSKYLKPSALADLNIVYDFSLKYCVHEVGKAALGPLRSAKRAGEKIHNAARNTIRGAVVNSCQYLFSDVVKLVNVILVLNFLTGLVKVSHSMIIEHKRLQMEEAKVKKEKEFDKLEHLYQQLSIEMKDMPTVAEFYAYVDERNPELSESARSLLGQGVQFQAKTDNEKTMEQIVAFMTLLMMLFDTERSDCLFRVLNKFKGVVGSIGQNVYHQSLDDVSDLYEDKQQTIDFDISVDDVSLNGPVDVTFESWWDTQLVKNNVVGHYRIGGEFMEFTRENAAVIAADVAHSEHTEFLIRGAVGSGKSTNLPSLLSDRGSVLLIEPTRPLCENVCKQLRGEPFHRSPTLRMRGLTAFGSTPITIMTSGFALHYYAHNIDQLRTFDFIIFDECHVVDSQAMAFFCLIRSYGVLGKVLKVSATPPGREAEFTTQHPVKLSTEDNLSFQQLVGNFGSGAVSDITQKADSILIYVASYNEVDQLSKLLLDKGHLVTKVDGRTMKVGRTEIETKGTKDKKHFIVATNIIENGVTLDIDAVVDFGLKVVPELDVENRVIRYSKKPISYGERIQRLGRVGRHKPGFALRIGHTEKGIQEIPEMAATEAAFLCFAYGLPVMSHNVGVSLLSKCTVRQARTMLNFEVSPFFMSHLVSSNGSMHPKINDLMSRFKLRDSEIPLSSSAIPHGVNTIWLSAKEYEAIGVHLSIPEDTRVPFVIKDIPEKIYIDLWEAIKIYRRDITFGRISSASAGKIAYTLRTDAYSIPRTILTIDRLIAAENAKHAHFKAMTSRCSISSSFSLLNVLNSIQSRYLVDHSVDNIKKLQAAKAQLQQFSNCANEGNMERLIQDFSAITSVYHQGIDGRAHVSKALGLKGVWNKQVLCKDIIICGFSLAGGAMMIYQHFHKQFQDKSVYHQGFSARQRQKLRFRQTRDAKLGKEVFADDGTIEHYFGEAYKKKGNKKGKMHGMGVKTRKFIATYGFKPEDYSYVRFLDPLTGETMDESPHVDLNLVQEQFGKVRDEYIDADLLNKQLIAISPGIKAYYVRNATKTALEVDLTPHNPLKVCDNKLTIAGFPDREFDLRQTGRPREIDVDKVPSASKQRVTFESRCLFAGMRNYSGITSVVCHLKNTSGNGCSLFGVGYNSYIITNRHLFRSNDGTLTVQSQHGIFKVKNTLSLKLAPVGKTDMVIIRMPKDFPPFHSRARFRAPKTTDKVCMVGVDYQENHIASKISDTSPVGEGEGEFGKHWISTRDGDCGNPLVCVSDGFIVGIHSLSNSDNSVNYFAKIPEDFEENYLKKIESLEWGNHWRYNPNEICWGALEINNSQPEAIFNVHKKIHTLGVYEQAGQTWLFDQLHGNLKGVCSSSSNLVTKHVVKGPCMLFNQYLGCNDEANKFFKPLMGHYMKSVLSREAYAKDLLKYASEIVVGEVDHGVFEDSVEQVIALLDEHGGYGLEYVTDSETIISALNMDAAVGALYTGKKRKYFENTTVKEREDLVQTSCKRLFEGKLGVWNGSLKAEIRPAEKVLAKKTRSFTAAPLDTLLGAKVCVDDFNNWFYSKNMVCPWTVGMTKFYRGWDEFLRLLPEGWIYCDADGSQFDSSLTPYLLNAVLSIRLWAMEDWHVGEQMLRNLYSEIIYTPILAPDGTIVKKFKGNNSGQPSTVVDNTLMVLITMYYALRKAGYGDNQHDVCRFFINGDDLVIAVHPEHEAMLDTFQASFAELGLKYDFSSRHMDRQNIWFMSHQGILKDNLYIPKLEPERIVAILEWDKAKLPEHRLEAIMAAIIESWGHEELTEQIRKFYQWVLEQAPYNELAKLGKAPYISEVGLRNLYTNEKASPSELEEYLTKYFEDERGDTPELLVYHQSNSVKDKSVYHQSSEGKIDAAATQASSKKGKDVESANTSSNNDKREVEKEKEPDRDVDVGSSGALSVPRIKAFNDKMMVPKCRGKAVLNLEHLIKYNPQQVTLSNTRSTQEQFDRWYEGVALAYGMNDQQMSIIMNGLMVWCIENGTSPDISGSWVMMDGDVQVKYPIQPLIENAAPTFRQIMAHFSNLAEAYIAKRNMTERYMPRYGLKRNLTDMSLARFAFDFYEINSKTPERAREAHMQMKAAALRSANRRLFGIDGSVSNRDENTERHTVDDVDSSTHSLHGMRR